MSARVRIAVAALAVAASPLAAAQTTLYGVVDTGVEYVNHVGAEGRGLTRVPTITATIPSRWGVRGSEDLGGGLKALFTLESGFGVDGGTLNQGGRLFGLQAWVGLAGNWGQLSVGRQLTMLLWSLQNTDVMGPAIYGNGSLDSYVPNARVDNAVAYKGRFDAVTVGATFSPGRDTVNAGPGPAGMNCPGETAASARNCREWSALLAYDAARWGANAAVDTLNGGPGAFGGLRAGQRDRRLSVGAYARLADVKLTAYWIRRDNDAAATARSDLLSTGVAYQVNERVDIAGQLSTLRYRDSANRATLLALRGTYALSKRTAVYLTGGYLDNHGLLALSVSAGAPGSNPLPGGGQRGTMAGIRHAF